jgi:hypothetical protein
MSKQYIHGKPASSSDTRRLRHIDKIASADEISKLNAKCDELRKSGMTWRDALAGAMNHYGYLYYTDADYGRQGLAKVIRSWEGKYAWMRYGGEEYDANGFEQWSLQARVIMIVDDVPVWGNITTVYTASKCDLHALEIDGRAYEPSDLFGCTIISLDSESSTLLRQWASQYPDSTVATDGLLTAAEAAAYYERLTLWPLRKQHWSRWAKRGDITARAVVRVEVRTTPSEVERIVREGLPGR